MQELPNARWRKGQPCRGFEEVDDSFGVAFFVVHPQKLGERPFDMLAWMHGRPHGRITLRARRMVLFRRPTLGRELEQALEDGLRKAPVDHHATRNLGRLAKQLGVAARSL
jgi:hypothetical protein